MLTFNTSDVDRRQGTITLVRPSGDPVVVAAAKRQLKIDPDDTSQDDFLAELCSAAHLFVESRLGYPILRQTRQTHLWSFPCGAIWLGGGDTLTVGQVRYFDTAGTQQVLPTTDYVVDAVSRPATIEAAPFKNWPATLNQPGAVKIDWTAGWAAAADVPADLIHAIRLMIGHWEQNREAVVVGTTNSSLELAVDALLEPHRLWTFR